MDNLRRRLGEELIVLTEDLTTVESLTINNLKFLNNDSATISQLMTPSHSDITDYYNTDPFKIGYDWSATYKTVKTYSDGTQEISYFTRTGSETDAVMSNASNSIVPSYCNYGTGTSASSFNLIGNANIWYDPGDYILKSANNITGRLYNMLIVGPNLNSYVPAAFRNLNTGSDINVSYAFGVTLIDTKISNVFKITLTGTAPNLTAKVDILKTSFHS